MNPSNIFQGLQPVDEQVNVQPTENPNIFSGLQPVDEQQQSSYGVEDLIGGVANKGAKAAMLAGKGLALAQLPVLTYELASHGQRALESTEMKQLDNVRNTAIQSIESLQEQKAFGKWDESDEKRLQGFYNILYMTPEEMKQNNLLGKPADVSFTSGLRESLKPFGVNSDADNVVEKIIEFAPMLAKSIPEYSAVKAESYLPTSITEKSMKDAVQIAKQSLKTYPIIGPSAIAEATMGWPMEVTMAVMGLGEAAGSLSRSAISALGKKYFLFDPTNLTIKNFTKSVQEELGRAPQYLAEQVNKGIMKAKTADAILPFLEIAEKNGVPVTPSTIANSKYFRNMEKLVAESDLSEEALSAFHQKVAQDWANVSQKALKTMQTDLKFSNPQATVEALQTEVTQVAHKKLREDATKLYQESAAEVKQAGDIGLDGLERIETALNKVESDIGSSRMPTSSEKGAKEAIRESRTYLEQTPAEAGRPVLGEVKMPMGNQLYEIQLAEAGQEAKTAIQGKGNIDLRRAELQAAEAKEEVGALGRDIIRQETKDQINQALGEHSSYVKITNDGKIIFKRPPTYSEAIDTIRSLNDGIQWQDPQVRNLLGHVLNEYKSIVGQLKESHPEAYAKYLEANKKWGQMAKTFGQDSRFKKWGIKSDATSEDLLRTLNSPEKWRAFEKEFGTTQRGKELINHLKYQKAREIIDPIFDMRDFKPGDIASGLHKLKRDPYFRELVPNETWKNLEEIQKLDALIERRSSKIYKPQKYTTNDKQEIFVGVKNEAKKRSWNLIKQLSKDRRATAFAEYFTDPSYTKRTKEYLIEIANEMGKAKPDKKKINQYQALINNVWNDLSQVSAASTVQSQSRKEKPKARP